MYAASWQSNLACQQNGLKIYCKLYIDHCLMIYYKRRHCSFIPSKQKQKKPSTAIMCKILKW